MNPTTVQQTRERWLTQLAYHMSAKFTSIGAPLPQFRVSIGFTSRGRCKRALAECWTNLASADGHHEIFISPTQAESERVADILAHELAHAAVGIPHGHNAVYGRVARALGLEGPLTATIGGNAFKDWVAPILAEIGPLPHAELRIPTNRDSEPADPRIISTAPPKQGTRLLKAQCDQCGYTCRITKKWITAAGSPLCPTHRKPMTVS